MDGSGDWRGFPSPDDRSTKEKQLGSRWLKEMEGVEVPRVGF
jgi:hypothetical protein